jgi:hypothetical protein
MPNCLLARLTITVFSLFGVVLIARPAFLFGNTLPTGSDTDKLEVGTPAQRLMAVGCVGSFSILFIILTSYFSVALVGVLGATGACQSLTLWKRDLSCSLR